MTDPTDRSPTDSSPTEGSPVVASTVVDSVSVRRSPRVFRFLLVGVALGVVTALVLTIAFPRNAQYSPSQVFGFLLLLSVTAGVALAGAVALLVERASLRRARTVSAERIVVAEEDGVPELPAAEQPPEPDEPLVQPPAPSPESTPKPTPAPKPASTPAPRPKPAP